MRGENVNYQEIEILFGSMEQWLSEKWRESMKAGITKGEEFLCQCSSSLHMCPHTGKHTLMDGR